VFVGAVSLSCAFFLRLHVAQKYRVSLSACS
jgi:hypothetical protein